MVDLRSNEFDFKNAILQFNGVDIGEFMSSDAIAFSDSQEYYKIVRGLRGDREVYPTGDIEKTADLNFMPSSGVGFKLWSEMMTAWNSGLKAKNYNFSLKCSNGFKLNLNGCIIKDAPPAYLPDTKADSKIVKLKLDYMSSSVTPGDIGNFTGGEIGQEIKGIFKTALTSIIGGR